MNVKVHFLLEDLLVEAPAGTTLQRIADAAGADITFGCRTGSCGAMAAWAESVAVLTRKVEAMLMRLGVLPYDAVIGSAYNPALHERVGNKCVEGMGSLLVVEQLERGYASQQPEFVLRRPKVLVSE